MKVILLERVERLGQMGDVVSVKSGYARNYLLPQEKALRATEENVVFFESQKKHLEASSLDRSKDAKKVAEKLEGLTISVIRQASEGGQLYGSVTTRDIAEDIKSAGFNVARKQVVLDRSFKMLGLYPLKISLHPDVQVMVTLNIARSLDEAKIQEERGEALISAETDKEELFPEAWKKRSKSKAKDDATEETSEEDAIVEEDSAEASLDEKTEAAI